MSPLREEVKIRTPIGLRWGDLTSGDDWLPVLTMADEVVYTPSTFPFTWEVRPWNPVEGILYCAWRDISEMQFAIAAAERETEDDEQDKEHERATENGIEQELEEARQ